MIFSHIIFKRTKKFVRFFILGIDIGHRPQYNTVNTLNTDNADMEVNV